MEVYHSIKTHRLRTIFTGFGVMWAMLLSLLLQGGSVGFFNGIKKKVFGSYLNQPMVIRGGYTQEGMPITLTEAVADHLFHNVPLFEQGMAILSANGDVSVDKDLHNSQTIGVPYGYHDLNQLALVEGRFFTPYDCKEKSSVCLLGASIKQKLFGSHAAIGKSLWIDGHRVTVIGLLASSPSFWNPLDAQLIVPNTLFKGLFPQQSLAIDHIVVKEKFHQNIGRVKKKIRSYLARQLHFKVQDEGALYIDTPSEREKSFQKVLLVLQGFMGSIGICLLLSGLVGVSNMMLVVVKERTRELAIRRVVGALSNDIIALILLESIIVNTIAGSLGIAMGMAIIEWFNRYGLSYMIQHDIHVMEPCRLQSAVIVVTLLVLVVSGGLAGLLPARRAGRIKLVEALNNK